MLTELHKYRNAYLALCLGLAIFLTAFLGFWPNRFAQRLVILVVMIFYFSWGVVTHLKTDSFTQHTLLEYGAVAVLGGTVLLVLTL